MTDAAESRPAPPADERRHPWARFWAKVLDIGAFSLLLSIPLAFINSGGRYADLIAWTMFLPLYPSIEGALIARTTGTPGKALFGISVTAADGAKLDVRTSIMRSFGCLLWGLALAIPFLSLAAMVWFGYRDYAQKGVTRWDRQAGAVYRARPTGKSWIVLCIIALVMFVLLFMISAASLGVA